MARRMLEEYIVEGSPQQINIAKAAHIFTCSV